MKDSSTIWERPITLSDVQPQITRKMIEIAELHLGYRLPAAYIELMHLQNGGNLRCDIGNEGHNTRIFGIGPNEDSITNNEYLPLAPAGLIPFDGLVDWMLCFDYRENPEEPPIVFVEIKERKIQSEKVVAINFEEYLKQLYIFEEVEIFVIETNAPIGVIARKIADVFKIPLRPHFNAGDLSYHGYYPGDVRVHLCGNKVPKYHQEQVLPTHATERDDLHDIILRHPEVDEHHLFLEIEMEKHEGQRHKMVKSLSDAGLVINTLKNLYSKS